PLVSRAKTKTYVMGDLDGSFIAERALFLNVAPQVRAQHELHDNEIAVTALAVVEYLNDVRMLEGGGCASLTLEPGNEFGVGTVDLRENLASHGAAYTQIDGAINRPHPSPSDGIL